MFCSSCLFLVGIYGCKNRVVNKQLKREDAFFAARERPEGKNLFKCENEQDLKKKVSQCLCERSKKLFLTLKG